MSILATDIQLLLSGGEDNTDPNASLGGVVSTIEIVDDTLHNLFDEVTGTEHTAGETTYRAFFVKNNSAETAYNVQVYLDGNSTGADSSIEIAKETSTGSPIQTVVDEATAPSGLSFSTANGLENALEIGNMSAGAVYGIWVKRIISAGDTPQANDEVVIKMYIDTL